MNTRPPCPTAVFRAARDTLLRHRTDPAAAGRDFRWPRPAAFNWALDWFDAVAADPARRDRTALRLVRGARPEDDTVLTWGELSRRSARLANWLHGLGLRRGDPVLLLLDNQEALWETMLACVGLGAVLVPTYITATAPELDDRAERARVRCVVADAALIERSPGWRPDVPLAIAVPAAGPGWTSYEDHRAASAAFRPDGPTGAHDPLLRYFTSGTTTRPKLVEHTHTSYPVGHLSGMYWNGLLPGDVHLNLSAPGWAKHAWSSFFTPWNAEAAVVALDSVASARPDAVLDVLRTRAVTSLCAPPAVWRALLAEGPGPRPPALREAVSAGEPLDAGLLDSFRRAWGIDVRDGYGQTETTARLGWTPGTSPLPGHIGSPLPGCGALLIDPDTGREAATGTPGELCLDLAEHPVGLMRGYPDDPVRTAETFAGGLYRTGDLMVRSPGGVLRCLGRTDDQFNSFGHRLSPQELEAAVLRCPAVREAAVVPVPDPAGSRVPKAYAVLAPGARAGTAAEAVFALLRAELPEEKRIRALEFRASLPRTPSGKVRRAALRDAPPGTEHRPRAPGTPPTTRSGGPAPV
ncbi:AMP-binding protein [Streptomyces sp. NPDC001985]|uniref:AMP-binding protein n=1 Tax=Streptomyces sp. NPDC001985 TaxID=3154406 RepID=UPI00331E5C55